MPSLRRVNLMPEVESIVVHSSPSDKEGVEFARGKVAYVVPKGFSVVDESTTKLAAYPYHQLLITSLRQSEDGQDHYLVGYWNYKAVEAKERLTRKDSKSVPILNRLARDEIVLTDHKAAVHIETVLDIMPDPMVHLNDTLPTHYNTFRGQDCRWVYRYYLQGSQSARPTLRQITGGDPRNPKLTDDITRCTQCRLNYSPNFDKQIFCARCKLWFHLGCVKLYPGVQDRWLEGDSLKDNISRAPIVRGNHWSPEDVEASRHLWMLFSSGQAVMKAKNGVFDVNFLDFNENSVAQRLSALKLGYYECPRCENLI
ncbi:hypothetical protein FA15DRAFT_671757 [Coprinopsis marcescibilis]|uniref:BAH domain-containing protein n=1 Tax=Coprinopsis marcescibilis TaxID=230819 RepID=A0A5C3KNW8_COPMA|nr:hypothetical protein FA15DRAFT_671757 [Coprinopsis marcescibilis]